MLLLFTLDGFQKLVSIPRACMQGQQNHHGSQQGPTQPAAPRGAGTHAPVQGTIWSGPGVQP